ncbi:hypothetical protein [Fulvivirga lutea]|uniref:SprB repeat-containing protein n=1 Tax=Fulvivirga lutea TaxID=2810512 RepID=A0A974WF79_9BACT|nr:hypothetical protein [Fulvivirga lutea]QSE96619.1 hypothetical protein JR347_13575 [Fulvivirga lutea]
MKAAQFICLALIIYSCSDSSDDPAPAVDCTQEGPTLSLVSTTDATSCNASDGTIEVAITGGKEPFEIQLRRNVIQNTFIDGLSPGFYDIQVIDASGCTDDLNILISAAGSDLTIDEISATSSGCNTSNGSVEITASGSGITYFLDGVESADNTFNGLAQGSYTVSVTDDSGCEVTSEITVPSGTSWAGQVKEIIQANCVLSQCHDGSRASLPDYSELSNVQSRADAIKSRTQSGNMPPASRPDLSQAEIDLIACWVDDGALDN